MKNYHKMNPIYDTNVNIEIDALRYWIRQYHAVMNLLEYCFTPSKINIHFKKIL